MKMRLFAIGMLLAFAAAARAADDEPKKVVSVEGITEYRLDNGLRVLLYPDPSKPKVTVNLTVFVGSRHEGYGETGMAHLLEHMLFKGTPDHPKIPKALKDHGADFNGTTWIDRTNYFETLTANDENLEFAIRLEADRLVNSYVKQEDLLSEMTVVRNEFEQGENRPEAILNQRVTAVAYEWHNYGKSTIGNRSDIERVPIKNLQAFYRKYYQPDNVMLIVAGNFAEDKALEYIQKYFGAIPAPKRKLDQTYTEEPPQDGERTVTLRRVGEVGVVDVAYHIPAGGHPDIAPLDVLSNILGTGPSSRLYEALVETRKATDVHASILPAHDPGLFEVMAEVRRDDPLEQVRDILVKTTEAVGKEGVSKEEVERAKQQLLKDRVNVEANTSRLAVQLSDWASQGDWRLWFLHRDRLEQVTADDVKRVAADYLHRDNRTVGMFIPSNKAEKTPIPETPDLAKLFADYQGREQVATGEAFDVSPQNIEKHVTRKKLAGGMKLVLLPKKTRGQTVNLSVTLRFGNLNNLKGLVAACEMLPELMTRGTEDLSRQEIEDQLDKHFATLHANGDAGKAEFNLQTKREHLNDVLTLLKQILREPSLAEDEFEIFQRETLAQLEKQLTEPQFLALTQVRRMVSPYPQGDVRYIPTIEEDLARYKSVSREQLIKLRDEYLGNTAGEVAVVGDFDAEETEKLLADIFDDWEASQSYDRLPRLYFADVEGGKQRIVTPDKENAAYMAGLAMPMNDADADYPAMVIGDFIFGGSSLASRLGDRVRQQEGLSYGVRSHFAAESLDERAGITLMAIYNPANVNKVVSAIGEELDRLVADGVTETELEEAKKGWIEEHYVDRTNDSHLVSELSKTAHVDRTMEYYADLQEKVGKLSTKQVNKALKKHVDPKRLAIVVAGDFKDDSQAEKPDAEKPNAEKSDSKAEVGRKPASKTKAGSR
ncbi:MAG TPA: pitrilysin family protein [Pirellulales bacterium]|nr:pitrilysin family protein [Pirellulales bacterium]